LATLRYSDPIDSEAGDMILLARLGNVLDWLGCVVAGVILAFDGYGVYTAYVDGLWPRDLFIFFGVIAFAAWDMRRDCRYVHATRSSTLLSSWLTTVAMNREIATTIAVIKNKTAAPNIG
jgi:hypothetical protein